MARLKKQHLIYKDIVEQALSTFANAIDAKDTYTEGHSRRVALFSREMARRMGWSFEEQEELFYIAMMHDIGKIGIPDRVLNKPTKLTDEEWEMVNEVLAAFQEDEEAEGGLRGRLRRLCDQVHHRLRGEQRD